MQAPGRACPREATYLGGSILLARQRCGAWPRAAGRHGDTAQPSLGSAREAG